MLNKIKKMVFDQRYRFDILNAHGFFKHVSDETFLKLKYKARVGKKLHLNDPKTFNEKLQWLKLYDRKPLYTTMVDKYEVKKYIAEKLGEEYVIPTLGVWDSFEEIDFDKLPDQFVLKCTHDSGGLAICRDKKKFDIEAAKEKINASLKRNYYQSNREWPYKGVKPRILAEKYMEDSETGLLRDYKFYCFNGSVPYLYISEGLENHETAKISFLTTDWNFAPFKRTDYEPFNELPKKPEHYDKMLALASELSKDNSFLRVDLYEIEGQIYFSEFTFSPCGGYMPFDPKEWDEKLGEFINLREVKNNE